jgi:hypothetical protein
MSHHYQVTKLHIASTTSHKIIQTPQANYTQCHMYIPLKTASQESKAQAGDRDRKVHALNDDTNKYRTECS